MLHLGRPSRHALWICAAKCYTYRDIQTSYTIRATGITICEYEMSFAYVMSFAYEMSFVYEMSFAYEMLIDTRLRVGYDIRGSFVH